MSSHRRGIAMFKNYKKMNTYNILKPKKLNLEYLVNKYKPEFEFNFDKAYLIIHLVMILGHEKDNLHKVGLHSKLLERLIGRDYHKYIRFLLDNNSGTGNVFQMLFNFFFITKRLFTHF